MNAPWPQPIGAPVELPASTAPSGISIENVAKTYPARPGSAEVVALDDINLNVPEGSIVGVIGRSGAGKSSLIRLINGLERPSRGRVIVNGTEITSLDEPALRRQRRSIGMIFQHSNLLSSRTAFDNIALPLEIAGVGKREIANTVLPLLDMVGLADKRDRYPAELSGGQKQRVGIARALATSPKVLLSDEATSALDPETTDQILELLKRINAELRLTVLFITHEMAVVKALADRVAVLERGHIVEEGTTYTVFASPRHEVTKRFVSSVTGSQTPDWLLARLKAERAPQDEAVLHVSFRGSDAGQPLLSQIARSFGIDINILYGQVEMIAGHPFGTLIVSIPSAPELVGQVSDQLKAAGSAVEHLGYVA
ncbi:MAG TPA: methionine ABC transporter ATP-binding protein [Rhodopseudomonas sp.]|uniref:methionine ABC transporter ATP-binding protein n=1 Tax=Rhodopseudomonas sp. TaxID=1078 RepID=UPI002ED7CCF8